MKYARVKSSVGPRYAEVNGEQLKVLDQAPWNGGHPTGETLALASAELLAVSDASKVVAVAQNYKKHAAEMGKPVPPEPLIFLKPSTALNAHLSPIVLPPESQEVHHEAEVAVVIGKTLKRASEDEVRAALFAVTCFNDVTARDIQKRETQHTRGKGYDTFACAGPFMVTGLDVQNLRVQARVNGQTRQDGNTSDMIFPVVMLVSFISRIMTLLPGDLVTTGTPSGVGPIRDGDVVEIEVEGVGILKNPVKRL
ncbi:MAG: fumarylacetoacetate hydrolase family protein [Archangiaceae bacterium]|nr:fumarylacetoacetate hydrolase family protein [Archangiaceae bacterium]